MFASRDIIISEKIQAHQLIPKDNLRLFNKQKVNLSLCLLINARFRETFAWWFYEIYYVPSLYKGIIDRVTGPIAHSNFCPKPMTCFATGPPALWTQRRESEVFDGGGDWWRPWLIVRLWERLCQETFPHNS